MCTQYFDLQNRTVGTYGYDWIEHFGVGHSKNRQRHLNLTVTMYAGGKLEPTYLNVAVNEQNDSKSFKLIIKSKLKRYIISL